MNSFDIDGVIYISKDIDGVYPGPNDIIITGRSYEEFRETRRMLESKGINNQVYFNPLPFQAKTRESSGKHKAKILNTLKRAGSNIMVHFEDDPIQKEVIERECPWITVVHLVHDLCTKENVRHEL